MTLRISAAQLTEIESFLQRYSDVMERLPALLPGSKSDLAEAILCLHCIQSYLSELEQLLPELRHDLQAAIAAKRREISMAVQLLREIRRGVVSLHH